MVPLTPFMGTMGVCPAGASAQPVMPPGQLRRQHGHPPARARHDAVPAGPGRGRAVLAPATPTAARATARSASPASRPRCTPRCASACRRRSIPCAAVPHRARPADAARSTTARSSARPASAATSTTAAQDATRAMIDHLDDDATASRARTRTCCARWSSTSRSPRSSTPASYVVSRRAPGVDLPARPALERGLQDRLAIGAADGAALARAGQHHRDRDLRVARRGRRRRTRRSCSSGPGRCRRSRRARRCRSCPRPDAGDRGRAAGAAAGRRRSSCRAPGRRPWR